MKRILGSTLDVESYYGRQNARKFSIAFVSHLMHIFCLLNSEDSDCDFDNLKLDVVMTGDKSDR